MILETEKHPFSTSCNYLLYSPRVPSSFSHYYFLVTDAYMQLYGHTLHFYSFMNILCRFELAVYSIYVLLCSSCSALSLCGLLWTMQETNHRLLGKQLAALS